MREKDAIFQRLETQYSELKAQYSVSRAQYSELKAHALDWKAQYSKLRAQSQTDYSELLAMYHKQTVLLKSRLADTSEVVACETVSATSTEESVAYVSKCLECGEILSSDTRQLCGKYVCDNA